MFFNGEWTRVERDSKNLVIRQELGPRTADREGEKLGDDLKIAGGSIMRTLQRHRMPTTYPTDCDTWIAEEEKLIHAGDDDRPDEPDDPCTQRGHRHGRVIGVGDRRAHLRIGGIVLCKHGELTYSVKGTSKTETHLEPQHPGRNLGR